MEEKDLSTISQEFLSKIQNVNEWIIHTKEVVQPNFFEIISLNMELLHINANSQERVSLNRDYINAYKELMIMEKYRKIYTEGLLQENNNLYNFFMHIKDEELKTNVRRQLSSDKENVETVLFTKCFSILYEIYISKKIDSNYKYRNKEEFENLKDIYKEWKEEQRNLMFDEYIKQAIDEIEYQFD